MPWNYQGRHGYGYGYGYIYIYGYGYIYIYTYWKNILEPALFKYFNLENKNNILGFWFLKRLPENDPLRWIKYKFCHLITGCLFFLKNCPFLQPANPTGRSTTPDTASCIQRTINSQL